MKDKPNKNTKKYLLSFLVLILLLSVTLYVIFEQFDFYEIIRQIQESSHKGFLLLAGASAFLYLFFYGRFAQIGLKAFGYQNSLIKSFVYGCADYFYAVITPSAGGGQPAVIYYMKKDGIPYSTATAVVILQTITYKSVLLLYCILSLFVIPEVVFGSGTVFLVCFIVGMTVSATGTTICVISLFRTRLIGKAGAVVIRWLAKLNIIKNADGKTEAFRIELEAYKDAAAYIKGRRAVLLHLFGATLLQRTSIFIIAFFIFKSFGLSGVSVLYILCIQASVEIAVELFPIPGYVGISEVATYLLFGSIYGPNEILTAAAMLLTNGFSRYFPFIISSAVIFCKHLRMNFLAKKSIKHDA